MKKHLLLLTVFLFMSFCANAQYTSIPDSNFEQELINDGYDSEGTLMANTYRRCNLHYNS
ncbi:hypothetical protein [Lacinutrix himadriensis]|uniref:hypothetical protein n=1 Tax=Lacinutrix himadriensis TaxID=641549 RepID=UPI000AE94F87|nr:hypothetical protein [Lacinutrix himadriensis]